MILIHEVDLPAYHVRDTPDYSLGSQVDNLLRLHYGGQELVVRAISGADHPNLDEVVRNIGATGTDRVDSNRTGRGYNLVDADFFAARVRVSQQPIFEKLMRVFYEKVQQLGKDDKTLARNATVPKNPLRIDLLTLYDPAALTPVVYRGYDARQRHDPFQFLNREPTPAAIKGLVRIL